MPLFTFNLDNGVATPKKLADTGNRWARISLQVMDASTLFFDNNKDTMAQISGSGLQQGFQAIKADRIVQLWWIGELWAVNSTQGAQVNVSVLTDRTESTSSGG